MNRDPLEQHVTPEYIAERLAVDPSTVYRWCQPTKKRPALLKSVLFGDTRRIPLSELQRLLHGDAGGGTNDNVRELRPTG